VSGADDEELKARLEDELKRLQVSDVLLQSCYTISSLGYGKLAGPPRSGTSSRPASPSRRCVRLHRSWRALYTWK
jgi:hypothetical protein